MLLAHVFLPSIVAESDGGRWILCDGNAGSVSLRLAHPLNGLFSTDNSPPDGKTYVPFTQAEIADDLSSGHESSASQSCASG
jgi:hypothetical protein